MPIETHAGPLEDGADRRRAAEELRATWIAVTGRLGRHLVRGRASREPVVGVLDRHVTADDGPGVTALVRAEAEDLFR